MTDVFQVNWKSLSSQEYLNEAKKATGVIWLGRPAYVQLSKETLPIHVVTDQDLIELFNLLDIRTRKYEIHQSYNEWTTFSRSCFTVWYKNNKGWKDIGAKNYSLKELALEKNLQNDPKFTRRGDAEFGNDNRNCI